MTPHRFEEYQDTTELAYHLVYDHGMTMGDAFVNLSDARLVQSHRDAHS